MAFIVYGTNGSGYMRFNVRNAKFNDANWHYIVWTYNGNSKVAGNEVYIDGDIQSKTTVGDDNLSTSIVNTNRFELGNLHNYNQSFQGSLDEFAVWNRVLNSAEVLALYSQGNGKFYGTKEVNWSGLAAYYRLDETSGSIAYDSICVVNGIITNATINQTGKNNKCVLLNANNENISLGNNFMYSYKTPFSFSLWIKKTVAISTGTILFGKYDNKNNRGYQSYINGGGDVYIILRYGTAYIGMGTPLNSISSTGVWYHIVITYNGSVSSSGFEIYINGIKQAHNTNYDVGTLTTIATTYKFYIGNKHTGAILSAGGYIDEFSIWYKTLNYSEIQSLYNQGNGNFY
jgi:hypothetical protein